MTLTLLLLIFIFIAFFSALTIILVTVKKERFPNVPTYNLLSFTFYFYKLDLIFINLLCVTSRKISELLFLPIWFSFAY